MESTYIPFAVHRRGRTPGKPPEDMLTIIRRLRAIAADPQYHVDDRAEARAAARRIAGTVGRIRRQEREAMTT